MCHHLALLDIRLRYPHLVWMCLCPRSQSRSMRGRARKGKKGERKQTADTSIRVASGSTESALCVTQPLNNKQLLEFVCVRRCENRAAKECRSLLGQQWKGAASMSDTVRVSASLLGGSRKPAKLPSRVPAAQPASSLLQGLCLTRQPHCSGAGGY